MPTEARQLVSGQRVDMRRDGPCGSDWAAQAPSTGCCVLSCSPSLAQWTQVEAISSSSEFCKSSHKFTFLGEMDNFKIWASTCRPVSVLNQPVRLWAPGLQLCHEQMVVWIQTRELTAPPSPDLNAAPVGSHSWGVPPWGRGRGSRSSPEAFWSPHGLSDPARGARVAHTHFELLAEDGALPQRRAVPAAIAELKLTLVQAHLRAFSYDDDGVGPALADRPLSGSQAWDLVTDDACAQSYHRGEAAGAGDTERWSVRPARWRGGAQPADPAWVSSPASSPPLPSRVSQLLTLHTQPTFAYLSSPSALVYIHY